ncbi:hypothetical protein GQ600_933 [Phytophthora cactorum]|nr:hypothetical protein GQ600_933 [Phytophthora cactorum]
MCIVGAGTVGLRAAIECLFLEKRIKFSRENMLHPVASVVQNLASLGAKVLFKNFCKSRTYFHVRHDNFRWFYSRWCSWWAKNAYSAIGIKALFLLLQKRMVAIYFTTSKRSLKSQWPSTQQYTGRPERTTRSLSLQASPALSSSGRVAGYRLLLPEPGDDRRNEEEGVLVDHSSQASHARRDARRRH